MSDYVAILQSPQVVADAYGGQGNPGANATLGTDLASNSGFTLIKYKSSNANTYGRTAADLARIGGMDDGNVFHFIDPSLDSAILALTNTTALDTYLNNWLAAFGSGSRLTMPALKYRIANPLNVNVQGLNIVGGARNSCVIEQTTLSAKILNLASTANFTTISGMRLAYVGGTPTSGATAIAMPSSYCHLRDFTIANSYVGIETNNAAVANKITDCELLDYESIGLFAHNCSDIYFSRFILNCGNTTRGALGGIRLSDKVEAFVCSEGDIINGAFSMATDATTNAQGSRPAYNRFTAVYFDSSSSGVTVNNSVEFDFVGCWFSNRPNNGVSLSNTDGMRFIGGGAINCGHHGVVVNNTCVRTAFNGFAARGNSQATANTYDGINIAAGTTDFMVKQCMLGGGLGFGSQRYGVNVNAGASDRYIIADNLVSGNSTGGVIDSGTGVNKRVANNY